MCPSHYIKVAGWKTCVMFPVVVWQLHTFLKKYATPSTGAWRVDPTGIFDPSLPCTDIQDAFGEYADDIKTSLGYSSTHVLQPPDKKYWAFISCLIRSPCSTILPSGKMCQPSTRLICSSVLVRGWWDAGASIFHFEPKDTLRLLGTQRVKLCMNSGVDPQGGLISAQIYETVLSNSEDDRKYAFLWVGSKRTGLWVHGLPDCDVRTLLTGALWLLLQWSGACIVFAGTLLLEFFLCQQSCFYGHCIAVAHHSTSAWQVDVL